MERSESLEGDIKSKSQVSVREANHRARIGLASKKKNYNHTMSINLKSPLSIAAPTGIASFPRELHLNVLTFLRATDLSALQRVSKCFNNRELIAAVVNHCANVVYPSDLTAGFDTPIVGGEVKSVVAVNKRGSRGGGRSSPAPALLAVAPVAEKLYTYEMLRNMEMLVVARVLSRPEPPPHERGACFYVSKSWCRAALRWLEVQEEEREMRRNRAAAEEEARLAAAAQQAASPRTPRGKGKHHNGRNKGHHHPGSSGKKKISRREQRQRDRKMSDAMPPWSNINNDIVCEHGSIKQCSTKSARARRRVLDRQAWKVLKRLYPESDQLEAGGGKVGEGGYCIVCAAEVETAKKAEHDRKEEERAKRKEPLGCPLVRGFYTRGSKGYPAGRLVPPHSVPLDSGSPLDFAFSGVSPGAALAPMPSEWPRCPLKPGVYCALPRSWCHQWRKYIRTGEGGMPPAPDSSEVLCDAHKSPVVPPHLEAFLMGETESLLGGNSGGGGAVVAAGGEDMPSMPVGGGATLSGNVVSSASSRARLDAATLRALRAAGMSESELHAQRVAMAGMEEDLRRVSVGEEIHHRPAGRARSDSLGQRERTAATNEQLDRENRFVVEILTDDEVTALERWWPRQSCTYPLRFAVIEGSGGVGGTDIVWSTAPCRECDPSSRSSADFVVRNRLHQKRGYR